MNKSMMVGLTSVLASFAVRAAEPVYSVWNVSATPGGNTPLTAYRLGDAANWSTLAAGGANGYGKGITFGNADKSPCFVDFGGKLETTRFNYGTDCGTAKNFYFLGDVDNGPDGAGTMRVYQQANDGILFGDLRLTGSQTSWYYVSAQVAGNFSAEPNCVISGTLQLRCDLFADSAEEIRPNPIASYKGLKAANGNFHFWGPKGADASASNWEFTDGSVYLKYAGAGKSTVVPGQKVSGGGIPAGTFVRRVYGTTGWIALSQSVSGTGTKEVVFDALTPSVESHFTFVPNAAGTYYISVRKQREQDGCRVLFDTVKSTKELYIGTDDASAVPGDLVVNAFGSTTGATDFYSLRDSRIEFGAAMTTPRYPYFKINAHRNVVRLTTPIGKDSTISTFKDLQGTLEKYGAGKLTVNWIESVSTGVVKVVEGELAILRDASVGGVQRLSRLEIAAGATFTAPSAGLVVETLSCGTGARVKGGRLTVLNRPEGRLPATVDGGEIALRFGLSANEAYPSDALALLFDATDADSLSVDTDGNVLSWGSSAAGGYCLRRKQTNPETHATAPGGDAKFRANACNGLPMVDLGALSWTNVAPGKSSIPDRSLQLYDKNDVALTAGNAPNYKTAFFFVGSEYGGGPLVGMSGSSFPSYSAFVHACKSSAEAQTNRMIVNNNLTWGFSSKEWTDARLADGTILFTVNGTTCNPTKTAYSGGFDLISYAFDNTYARFAGLGFWGESENASYPRTANGLLYGELAIFSRVLTAAERTLAEDYLRCKWTGVDSAVAYRNLQVAEVNVGEGSKIVGLNAGRLVAGRIAGSGTVEASLALQENGTIEMSDGNGLSVAGDVTLPQVATVLVDRRYAPGSYPILSADRLSGDVSQWTVEADGDYRRSYRLFTEGNAIVLAVERLGFVLQVR